ncbi:MAG: VF530 family protein [Myxococcota bacterium]|nr:VF530 family protein [Myxococcota bacterium]
MSNDQPRNPLHGVTLKALLTELVDVYGFEDLSHRVRINCFAHEPSIKSSLKFLRKTPWAREKVESLYLWHLREQKRQARRAAGRPDGR